MKFSVRVVVQGNAVYRIDEENEQKALSIASQKAIEEFNNGKKKVSVISLIIECVNCGKRLWDDSIFCPQCGTPRPGKEITENGHTIQQ